LPANAPKLTENDRQQQYHLRAKKRLQRNGNKSMKRTAAIPTRLSASTVRAFLDRATIVEQQHQIMTLCNTNAPITTEAAISLAKVVGRTASELEDLPKLKTTESCPTNVDMCLLLDASPLWHLDTMVSALHTDSLRAPKELNKGFIDDLLQITNAQYQHFLEVSAILQKLVRCPEVREITLEGYELRVHFVGTTLFDLAQFLQQLAIDPKSPHFDLEEIYVDSSMSGEQYFPQASVGRYYAPSLSDNETWDDCNSLQSSMMMYTDSERCSSVASFAPLDCMPLQESPWEGIAAAADEAESDMTEEDDNTDDNDDQVAPQGQDMIEELSSIIAPAPDSAAPTLTKTTADLFPGEESMSPWKSTSASIQESTHHLDRMSSKILNSTVVSEEYFDDIRGFLDSIEAVHRHSERIFGTPTEA